MPQLRHRVLNCIGFPRRYSPSNDNAILLKLTELSFHAPRGEVRHALAEVIEHRLPFQKMREDATLLSAAYNPGTRLKGTQEGIICRRFTVQVFCSVRLLVS